MAAAEFFVSSINNDCFAATHRCSSLNALDSWDPKVRTYVRMLVNCDQTLAWILARYEGR